MDRRNDLIYYTGTRTDDLMESRTSNSEMTNEVANIVKMPLTRVSIQSAAEFLVACYATLHPAMSVRRSVSRSVGWSPFYFFCVFELFEHTAPAQMP